MKRIIFMFALVLGLSACDNTKLKLRAPQNSESATRVDSLKTDTTVMDSTHAAGKKVIKISTI